MKMKRRQWMTVLIYLGILITMVTIVASFSNAAKPVPKEWTTGELMAAARNGEIHDFTYSPATRLISGTTAVLANSKEATSTFEVYVAGEETFRDFVTAAQVGNPKVKWNVTSSSPNPIVSIIGSALPILIMVGLFFLLFRNVLKGGGGGSGVMSFGKSKAKLSNLGDMKITFKDVAGCDEAVEELKEIKDFLSKPERFKALGAKIPKGVLLVGPPGTGKTLLAKAVAGEAGVPFFTVSGSDFVEMFVGVGAGRVRDTFSQAKAAAPAIVFIDEIDAVGGSRGRGGTGSNDEREQTLNALLVEMDGFHEKDTVIVMAATNRVDMLDPALLRPGRFDRQIMVDRPDLLGREEILQIHSKGKPLAEDLNLAGIARSTAGMSGADLANLMNESALLAARRGGKKIENIDLKEAMERVMAGLKRKHRVMNEKERTIVAYHEAGHALVGHILKECDPINKVTILPRGRALGYTMALPEEDTFLESKKEMISDISMMLGGRAAEEIVFNDITTGAGNDIERASSLASQMITRFGMSDKLGPRSFKQDNDYGVSNGMSGISEDIATVIDNEVKALIDNSYESAKDILTKYRDRLDKMSEVLLDRETIEGDALQALLEGTWDEFLIAEAAQERIAEAHKNNKSSDASKDIDGLELQTT